MKRTSIFLTLLILMSCHDENSIKPTCPCGDVNPNKYVGNVVTNQKSVFTTSGYTYHFCSTPAGDLISGFEKDGVDDCNSLLKTVGFNFTVKSDPLASYVENTLGADLHVIVVDNENRVQELIHPSNSLWSNTSISGTIQAKGSIASYWSTDLRYQYVYFIGTDGGLYALFKDNTNNQWTAANNLLPLVGLANSASEIVAANIAIGTSGDDLYISFRTNDNVNISLIHLSTEQWRIL